MNMMNGGNGPFMFPFFTNQNDDDVNGGKVPHDSYRVYVNGDYIGNKISVSQGDGDWKAIGDYLEGRNFKDYEVSSEGNEVYVEVENKEEMMAIRNHLEVYTQLR